MSIGEVLSRLRIDFPGVTISKIRFLESEGLVEPERSSSGYRKFSLADLERLRYVLAAQRDRYLPLRVIKEHLDAFDRGLEPPAAPGEGPQVPTAVAAAAPGMPDPATFAREAAEVRLSREELAEASGAGTVLLGELETYGLASPRSDGLYDAATLEIVRAVAELRAFGLEPRHLRAFKAAADREVGLIEQVVSPLLRQRGSEGAERAAEVSRQLAALSVRLHAALVRAGLRWA
jgi:DNA-binding transcriptional MerR regulator